MKLSAQGSPVAASSNRITENASIEGVLNNLEDIATRIHNSAGHLESLEGLLYDPRPTSAETPPDHPEARTVESRIRSLFRACSRLDTAVGNLKFTSS